MNTLTIGSQKTFADVQTQLLGPNPTAALASNLQTAIQSANPGVNLNQLTPGMVLNVPSTAFTTASLTLAPAAVGNYPTMIQSNLATLNTQLAQSAKSQASQIATLKAALSPAVLKEVQSNSPAMATRLTSIQASMQAEAAADQAAIARLATIQQQAACDWATLAKKFPGMAALTGSAPG
jgi:hypothetical protein